MKNGPWVGSVLGVLLGGVIAAHWGWRAAFGVVGVPGLVLALLCLKVRDYDTVPLEADGDAAGRNSLRGAMKLLAGVPTLFWICVAAPAQVVLSSAVWAWLPSYLNRVDGLAPEQAALVVLCVGGIVLQWLFRTKSPVKASPRAACNAADSLPRDWPPSQRRCSKATTARPVTWTGTSSVLTARPTPLQRSDMFCPPRL